jgi:hypothetical protein
MAKYVPKSGDIVFRGGKGLVRFVITDVNHDKKTADVKTVSGAIVLTREVPWNTLQHLDESQNALRVVREATENK